jgi:CheY-like chemotaxis protein
MRFLIVDDDPTITMLLSSILKSELGMIRVDRALNAEEALNFISKSAYDVLITDQMMPGENGTSLIRQARAIDPSLVIVLMSAIVNNELIKEAFQLGDVSVLSKPLEIDELLGLIPSRG